MVRDPEPRPDPGLTLTFNLALLLYKSRPTDRISLLTKMHVVRRAAALRR